jgi:hypothetical protein
MGTLAKLIVAIALGALVVAAPAAARVSGSNCDYADNTSSGFDQSRSVGSDALGDQVWVYLGRGVSGDADITAVGACANLAGTPLTLGADRFEGGTAEAGVSVDDGVVGTPAWTPPAGPTIPSTQVGPTTRPSRPPASTASASSTSRSLNSMPVPLIVCGNTSGNEFESTARDGCFISY